MSVEKIRRLPGNVRDAIIDVLSVAPSPLPSGEIEARVESLLGPTPGSSIRSYLRLNTPELFVRERRGVYGLRRPAALQKELTQGGLVPS